MTERFELLSQLGKGGMGVVWKARDSETGEIVALKLLHSMFADDPEYVARFEREVEVAQRISSPHVVRVVGFGRRAGQPYMAMELIDGPSLKEVLRQRGRLRWEEASGYIAQVLQGLAAAHAVGVLHRDIKPANLLLAASGTVKLVDFGISRATDLTRLTGGMTMLGTPTYMAPEGQIDERSELYSVGVVAYELLAGQPPFVGDTMHSIIAQHMRDTPDLRQLPLEAREFVGRLLEKAPADRFSSSAVLGDSGVRDPDQTFHNRTVNRSRWETPNARVEDRAPKPLRNSTVLRPEQSEVAALERADDSKIRHGSILATLFSFQGRTGRATWAWVWVGWLAWFVVAALSSPIATELVVVFVGWSLVAVSTRRLHDLDKSGWWLLWVAAPGAVLVLLPMLALTRGNPVANRFGDLA